jgi:hypothetical protein
MQRTILSVSWLRGAVAGVGDGVLCGDGCGGATPMAAVTM